MKKGQWLTLGGEETTFEVYAENGNGRREKVTAHKDGSGVWFIRYREFASAMEACHYPRPSRSPLRLVENPLAKELWVADASLIGYCTVDSRII